MRAHRVEHDVEAEPEETVAFLEPLPVERLGRPDLAPVLRALKTMRYVAAGELGSGVFFNPVAPEDAADDLRQA